MKLLFKSVLAGMFIGLACQIYLLVPNKYVACALFSAGLISIRLCDHRLFTGLVQYIPTLTHPPMEYVKVLIGNVFGVLVMSFVATGAVHEAARAVMEVKAEQTVLECVINGFGCGMLMTVATLPITPLPVTALCIMAFLLAGFNHSIADAYYMFSSHYFVPTWFATLAGNTVGGAIAGFAWLLVEEEEDDDEDVEEEDDGEDIDPFI